MRASSDPNVVVGSKLTVVAVNERPHLSSSPGDLLEIISWSDGIASCVAQVPKDRRESGYLRVEPGWDVEVRHVGEREPILWVYASHMPSTGSACSSVPGWLALSPPSKTDSDLRVGSTAEVFREIQSIVPRGGYLSAKRKDIVEVLHCGTGDEYGWIYARHRDNEQSPSEGWFPAQYVSNTKRKQPAKTTGAVVPSGDATQPLCDTPLTSTTASQCTDSGSPTDLPETVSDPPVGRLECAPGSEMRAHAVASCPAPPMKADMVQHGMHMRILTFGLENCDKQLTNLCVLAPTGGARVTIDEDNLYDALERLGYRNVNLFSDARCFPDPNAHELRGHIGIHPEIISRMVHHRRFGRWMRGARNMWYDVWDEMHYGCSPGEEPDCFTLALYCKSGKHRSVAAAEIFRYIFETVELFNVSVEHISEMSWGRGSCRGRCLECQEPSRERQEALELAAEIWRAAGC